MDRGRGSARVVRSRYSRNCRCGKNWLALIATAAAGTAAVAALAGLPGRASAATPPAATKANNQFFDWQINTSPSYVPSPVLNNSSAHAVNAFLQQLPPNSIRAVKILEPISNSTSNLIFNNSSYHVSYVLGDLEGSNAPSQIKTIAQQVRFINGQNNGSKTKSSNAFIGNFGFYDLGNDVTKPSGYNNDRGEHSFAGWTQGDFTGAKLNMSMPELYNGSASYRNPAAGNSSAPNIRSALFTLPLLRVSQTQVSSPSSEAIVPYIARFNNWNNIALDSDRNSANGFKFVPGQAIPAKFGLPGLSASQTANQMISRRDFASEVLHMRLRGAESYVAFEPGVQGYLSDVKRADAKTGWTESHVNSIFAAADAKLLLGADTDYPGGPVTGSKDYNGNITVDGTNKSDESAGALFSGVYSLTLKKMDVLLSNMDDDDHTLTLPPSIGGFSLKTKAFDVDAGAHLLVEYKLTTSGVNKGWSVMMQQFPFLQLPNNRNEVGIPEPANLTLLAVAAFGAVTPRRRRKQTA
jgi:hypothetical protein